jgi:hypothetical protein
MPAGRGTLRIVSPKALQDAEKVAAALDKAKEPVVADLAAQVRRAFDSAKRHRTSSGVDLSLITAMRAYNGEYSPEKKAEITKFGGSDVYARVTSAKCRGATALLRDIYLSNDRPWSIEPTPNPKLPGSIEADISTVVGGEALTLVMGGEPPQKQVLEQRKEELRESARMAERKKAAKQAVEAQRRIDDVLVEGMFWQAFSEFLADLPVYRCAIIKGPTVRVHETLEWTETGEPQVTAKPKFFWDRVSPFDVWFTPGASTIDRTDTFERQRFTLSDLYDLIGLPGYREEEIREVISRHESGGLREWGLMFEEERRQMEGKGPTQTTDDKLVDCIEFQGHIMGSKLKDYGIKAVTDMEKPYFVTCWLIDRHVIKVMLNPNLRKRPNYYATSFDKQPGTIYGSGISELMGDVQNVMNATLRSLVNNMSIASGPQVYYNEEMLNPTQDDMLYPWKRWKYTTDPANPSGAPLGFFQPQSNAQELLAVYAAFNTIADEVSAIPRYMTGDSKIGGAGRTASGLAMLMTNANKALQNVAENVDRDVFYPLLQSLYDMVMLTDDTNMLRGDESIKVNGVRNVIKQEQDRVRQLEFLQLTANEIDGPIVGAQRAEILQQVANRIGLELDIKEPGEEGPAGPPQGGPGAGPNPGGGPGPDGAVVDNAPPRMQTRSLNTVSSRNTGS